MRPFLFLCHPHLHVAPEHELGKGAPLLGLCVVLGSHAPLCVNRGQVARPLPIPVWTPFMCHPGAWTKGRGRPSGLAHALVCAPPLQGAGGTKKRGGAPLLGLCVPHSRCCCAQGGRGCQFPFLHGPLICVLDLHTNGGGGRGTPHVWIPPPHAQVAPRPSAVLCAPTIRSSSHFHAKGAIAALQACMRAPLSTLNCVQSASYVKQKARQCAYHQWSSQWHLDRGKSHFHDSPAYDYAITQPLDGHNHPLFTEAIPPKKPA